MKHINPMLTSPEYDTHSSVHMPNMPSTKEPVDITMPRQSGVDLAR